MKSTSHRLPGDREGVTEVFFFSRVLEHVALSGCGGVGGQMRAVSHIKLLAGASSGSEETRRSQMIWRCCLRIQQLSVQEGESRWDGARSLQRPAKLFGRKKKGSSCFLPLFISSRSISRCKQASSNIEQRLSNCWMTETCCVYYLTASAWSVLLIAPIRSQRAWYWAHLIAFSRLLFVFRWGCVVSQVGSPHCSVHLDACLGGMAHFHVPVNGNWSNLEDVFNVTVIFHAVCHLV